jgi:hypothetical protein
MKDINKLLDKLLKKYLPKFVKSIQIDYGVGSAIAITNAKRSGVKTNANPLNLTKKEQQIHIDNIDMLIKDVNSDVSKKINLLTNQSITEKWSTNMLGDKLEDLFNKDVPGHFTYKNRFNTIAQDQSFKLMSQAADKKSRQLGATRKWLFNTMDKKTAEDSKVADNKYGSEDKAIPINEPFTYTLKGIKREFMMSPDRVNDRSITIYTWD